MKEMTEEEERRFWEMDNYDELLKEVEYYRKHYGDSYRLTHPVIIPETVFDIGEFLQVAEDKRKTKKKKRTPKKKNI